MKRCGSSWQEGRKGSTKSKSKKARAKALRAHYLREIPAPTWRIRLAVTLPALCWAHESTWPRIFIICAP